MKIKPPFTGYMLVCLCLFLCSACDQLNGETSPSALDESVTPVGDAFPEKEKVWIIAHRGDWRNFPENSIEGIQSCIEKGFDIIEIDVRLTKDSIPVLMHDVTLDRTTNGKGKVADLTWQEVQQLNLKNGLGRTTIFKVPSLEEVLKLTKGKIIINLDKSYSIFKFLMPYIRKYDMSNQILLKGEIPVEQMEKDLGPLLTEIQFMPIVNLKKPGAEKIIEDYLSQNPPFAIEYVFGSDTAAILNNIRQYKKNGVKAWANSLWPSLNGGHDDDLATTHPEEAYGWLIAKGFNMIQTDRPVLLKTYLEN